MLDECHGVGERDRPGPRTVHVAAFSLQAEVGIRVHCVTGVQTCALPIFTTEEVYANCRPYLQERIFVGNRQASSTDQTPKIGTELTASEQQQISRADTFFIATDNPEDRKSVV